MSNLKLFEIKNIVFLFFLVSNPIIWFYLAVYLAFLADKPLFPPLFRPMFFIATLSALLIGPKISRLAGYNRFINGWIIFGMISSLLPLLSANEIMSIFTLIFWGLAFGIGFPSCLASIPRLTKIENRGRISGITLCLTYLTTFALFLVAKALHGPISSLLLFGWRSLGLGARLFISSNFKQNEEDISYSFLFHHKTLILYLLPWLAFCLVNYSQIEIAKQYFGGSIVALVGAFEFIGGSIFCLIGGWIMDFKGRKTAIIIGFTVLGLGYALLSMFHSFSSALIVYAIADSVAFGIFSVAFILVIWGDIAGHVNSEKFYALGSTPVPIAITLSAFLSIWLKGINIGAAFSFATLFIFLAIIPILFAPELLPEKVLKEKELKKYIMEVRKFIEERK